MMPLGLALILLILFAGIIWLAHCNYLGLYLDLKIRPVELATLVVNLFIALFLSQYFMAKASNLRAEKDFLISELRKILEVLSQASEELFACYGRPITQERRKAVLSLLRRLGNDIESLETGLGASKCSKLAEHCDDIKNAYLDYKASATGGRFPSAPLTQDQISDSERRYRTLRHRLQQLLFAVNRHD